LSQLPLRPGLTFDHRLHPHRAIASIVFSSSGGDEVLCISFLRLVNHLRAAVNRTAPSEPPPIIETSKVCSAPPVRRGISRTLMDAKSFSRYPDWLQSIAEFVHQVEIVLRRLTIFSPAVRLDY
jgi:hypothetical protein